MSKKSSKLKTNKYSFQRFIEIIMQSSGIFLFAIHLILMGYYLYLGVTHMIILNIISIIFYIILLLINKNGVSVFSITAFFEIIIHMIIATLTFGIESGFQNWCFGFVCCFFLPTFSTSNKKRLTISSLCALIFMASFFILTLIVQIYNIRLHEPINSVIANQLFIINSIISFVTIISFTTLYASTNNKRYDELIKKANYDELTSLYNRHALNEVSGSFISNASNTNKPYAVAIIDIDYFKEVNDTYGHAIGDEVLKELASIIRAESIKGIVAGRWGGEEFVLISPSTINYDEFVIILEKLREKVAKTKISVSNGKKLRITISIGAYKVDNYKLALDEAIAIADDNLYESKDTGRNKVIY